LTGVLFLASGTALAQLIALLGSPIVTRLYTPPQFGVLGTFASLTALLWAVASGGYERAVPIAGDDQDALAVLGLCFVILGGVVSATGILIWMCGAKMAVWVGMAALVPYLWLVPAALFLASAYGILSMWTIRCKRHSLLAQTNVGRSGGTILTQIGLGVFAAGALGLLVADLVGRALAAGMLARDVWRKGRAAARALPASELLRLAGRYRRFPMLSVPATVLNRSTARLPPVLLLAVYGPAPAGWFALCEWILAAPVTLLGQSVGKVYLGEASEIARRDPARLESLLYRVGGKLLLVSLPPSVLLFLIGPWLFGLVFGSRWVEAGQYARALSVSFPFMVSVGPLVQTLLIMERQGVRLFGEVLRALLTIGAMSVLCYRGFPARTAIWGYSVGLAASYLLRAWLVLRVVRGARAS
jgi:O-antigen/teichoic acid export membrane protein